MEKSQAQTNSEISQAQSEQSIRAYDMKLSLALAMERTQTELLNIDEAICDVLNKYPKLEISRIQTAIKNGSLGDYGRTYRMSTQEICIWINEYIKQNPSKEELKAAFMKKF